MQFAGCSSPALPFQPFTSKFAHLAMIDLNPFCPVYLLSSLSIHHIFSHHLLSDAHYRSCRQTDATQLWALSCSYPSQYASPRVGCQRNFSNPSISSKSWMGTLLSLGSPLPLHLLPSGSNTNHIQPKQNTHDESSFLWAPLTTLPSSGY